MAPKATLNYFLVSPKTASTAINALGDFKSRTFMSGAPIFLTQPSRASYGRAPSNRETTHTPHAVALGLNAFLQGEYLGVNKKYPGRLNLIPAPQLNGFLGKPLFSGSASGKR